jgi:hypothetical protein
MLMRFKCRLYLCNKTENFMIAKCSEWKKLNISIYYCFNCSSYTYVLMISNFLAVNLSSLLSMKSSSTCHTSNNEEKVSWGGACCL